MMSLTTLGSQLSGLNLPRKDLGSTLSRSRQHEDSIGRGLSHSVQLGHSNTIKSKISRPSIMNEDAGRAADVPLVTLQANCMASLRHLELRDSRFGNYVELLSMDTNRKEQALMTQSENDELYQTLDGLLHRLILRISDNSKTSKTAKTSVFHVIEYLLCRYDIHLQPLLAETVLRLTIPFHEDPIFLRMIQLVDLSILPTWSFLRPYAAPGATVAREIISKQASIDVSLLSSLCLLAQRSAGLPCNAHHLSFTATVISECAAFQVTRLGGLTERTCHTLLQQTLGACRQSKNVALQNWGHVMASTIVETASLADESLNILVTSILKGIADSNKSTQLNGLLVAFSSISKRWKHFAQPLQEMQFFLGDENGMKISIFEEFLAVKNLAAQLGHLFCEGSIDQVSRWIACMLVVGARLLQENATTKVEKVRKLILDLINEPNLRILWETASNRYLESFAAVFVEILARKSEDALQADNDFEQAVFKPLNSIDSSAFENGIASALFRMKGPKRQRVLHRILTDKHDAGIKAGLASESLLSPLIDVEHGSDGNRIKLIQTIIGQHNGNEFTIHQSRKKAQALLDLLNHDTNNTVAIAAGIALVDFLRSQQLSNTACEIGEAALQAAYKWFDWQLSSSFKRSSVLEQVLRVLEAISLNLVSIDSASPLFCRIIECLGAFCSSSIEVVAQHSSGTLHRLLGTRGIDMTGLQKIHVLLVSDETILHIFRREVLVGRSLERCVRHHCVQSLLQGFLEMLRSCQNGEKRKVYTTEATEYCLWAATTFANELELSDRTLLQSCILSLGNHFASSHQQMQHFITGLASAEGIFFTKYLSPLIQNLCASLEKKNGSKIPGLNVLMDVAVFASQQANDTTVTNILSIAKTYIEGFEATLEEVQCAIATTLCFLTDMNVEIRREAVNLLKSAGSFLAKIQNKLTPCLIDLCAFVTENESDVSIGDATLLPWCLASVMSQSKQKKQLLEALLSSCANAGCSLANNECFATSGCFTAAVLLTAAELAGEEIFPLEKRWELAGSPILKHIQSHLMELEQIHTALKPLISATIRMLLGLKVINSTVDAGPKTTNVANSGARLSSGRNQSDPFRESDRGRFLIPYPKGMEIAILSILKIDAKSNTARMLQENLVVQVVRSQSWKSEIFAVLSSTTREKIAIGTLSGIIDGVDGFDQDIFLNLPLSTSEVMRMIESAHRTQVEISYLSEYAVFNKERLNRESPNNNLILALFGSLEASLSSGDTAVSTENDYSCEGILSAVLELLKSSSTAQLRTVTTEAKAQSWVAFLLHILVRNVAQETFQSPRVHKTFIALLDALCPSFPSVVVKQLIPAMNATIAESIDSNAPGFLIDCLVMIVPQFLRHAALAGLEPIDLFKAFVSHSIKIANGKKRTMLYQGFLKALSRMSVVGLSDPLPGAFVSTCLAMELHFEGKETIPPMSAPLCDLASMILNDSHIAIKTSSTIAMLAYGKEIIGKLLHGKETNKTEATVKVEDLIFISVNGTIETCERNDLIGDPKSLMLCNLLLQSVCKNTQTTSFQAFLHDLDSSDSKKLLPFWQDLIMVQAAGRNVVFDSEQGGSQKFWKILLKTTDEILCNLHSFIPVHIFLAFATSVIENGESDELRSIAVHSIGDRAILFHPHDAEATLFCETLPFLTEMLCCDGVSVFQQSLLVVIETVARKLCLGFDLRKSSSLEEELVTVINKSARLIKHELSCAEANYERIAPLSRETICIASLCASTCIRICGPRALKTLPILMKAYTDTLCMINGYLSNEGVQQRKKKEAKLMQASSTHSIIAVVETLPQFLAPFLKDIFDPLALPSKAFREQDDGLEIVDKLNTTLVSHTPTRLLLPALLEAIESNHLDVTSLLPVVSLLNRTISKSSRQDVVCHATRLLEVVTSTLDYPVQSDMQSQVLHAAHDLFLGFVLKLSEFQLRSLYLKLREWKGDLDIGRAVGSARRQAAFWSLSAALAKHLHTIYLPCLSLIFTDLISELEYEAMVLCGRLHAPGASEGKRLRLDQKKTQNLSLYDTTPVENILLCLQQSLRSDAHDGGRWIREGNSQKFERLLDPLSKLLQSACPPKASSISTYEKVVQGTNPQSGSVIACIVSLALAAGDEQLWKPLNHHVLQAASSATRVEVRRAGVKCLASLIQTIGEEYMIFIPECLPVLSELLEDTDPSITSLAQDCITLSEEFLGENLQDRL